MTDTRRVGIGITGAGDISSAMQGFPLLDIRAIAEGLTRAAESGQPVDITTTVERPAPPAESLSNGKLE